MNILERLLALLGLRLSPRFFIRKAARLAARENLAAAAEMYKKALALDPVHIPAYDGLGRLYFRMGFRDEAEREFAIADGLEKLDQLSEQVDVGVKMGRAFMDKGLHQYATVYLEPVLQGHPNHKELLKIVGLSFKVTGNGAKARKYLQAGMEAWPYEPDFYRQLASLEIKAGSDEEGETLSSLARLLAGIEDDPSDTASLKELAHLFFERSRFQQAVDCMRKVVDFGSEQPEDLLFLGECYSQAGQYSAAQDTLKQTVQLAPDDPRPHKILAQLYQMQGRFNESRAESDLAELLEGGQSGSQSPQQGARFIMYLLSIGKREEASGYLKQCLEKWPDSVQLKLIQGRLMYREKKYQEVIELLQKVVRKKDTLAEPHILMAMAYQRLGNGIAATAEGQLATRLAPKSITAHQVIGDIYREQKKFGMAASAYETAENLRANLKKSS